MIIRNAELDDDEYNGIRLGGRLLTNLRYAYDTTIMALNIRRLETSLINVKTASQAAGLYLNLAKTKVFFK